MNNFRFIQYLIKPAGELCFPIIPSNKTEDEDKAFEIIVLNDENYPNMNMYIFVYIKQRTHTLIYSYKFNNFSTHSEKPFYFYKKKKNY